MKRGNQMRIEVVTLLLVCFIAIGCSSKTPEERWVEQMSAQMESLGITGNAEMFETAQKVRYGMTTDEVIGILGSEGEVGSNRTIRI